MINIWRKEYSDKYKLSIPERKETTVQDIERVFGIQLPIDRKIEDNYVTVYDNGDVWNNPYRNINKRILMTLPVSEKFKDFFTFGNDELKELRKFLQALSENPIFGFVGLPSGWEVSDLWNLWDLVYEIKMHQGDAFYSIYWDDGEYSGCVDVIVNKE